jgi:hypothetical protein
MAGFSTSQFVLSTGPPLIYFDSLANEFINYVSADGRWSTEAQFEPEAAITPDVFSLLIFLVL